MGIVRTIVEQPEEFSPLVQMAWAAHKAKRLPKEPTLAFCYDMLNRVSRRFLQHFTCTRLLDQWSRRDLYFSVVDLPFSCACCCAALQLSFSSCPSSCEIRCASSTSSCELWTRSRTTWRYQHLKSCQLSSAFMKKYMTGVEYNAHASVLGLQSATFYQVFKTMQAVQITVWVWCLCQTHEPVPTRH